jgi:hypothetical protein
VEASSIAATSEELAEGAEFIEGEETAALIGGAEAEIGAAVAADAAVAGEVATVAAAEAASAWNVVSQNPRHGKEMIAHWKRISSCSLLEHWLSR